MFTRLHDDACYVHQRDGQNEEEYRWRMSQEPNFRRDTDLYKHMYRQNSNGIEKNIHIENRLLDLNRVAGSCNSYEAGIQQDRIDIAPPELGIRCLNNGLQPTYTKMSRIANHSYTYENPQRADPGWYWFTTPPDGRNFPGQGLYAFARPGVDTRLAAKDEIVARGKYGMNDGKKIPNPHAVPLLKGCSHMGMHKR